MFFQTMKKRSERLFEAIGDNDMPNVRICIEQGVDLKVQRYSERVEDRMAPLALACYLGHEEIMEELLKAGADPNQVSGSYDLTAMHMAVRRRVLTLAMIQSFISYGVDVEFRDGIDQMTILHHLANGMFSDTDDNLLSAAKLLLNNGVSFYARALDSYTPFYLACRSGNINLVKLFIAEGADINYETGHMTMLKLAADDCNIDMFDVLLNAGANRQLTPDAFTKLCDRNGRAMIAKILDTCDVDINMPLDGKLGMRILHYACKDYNIKSETVRLLLDRGADVRAVSDTRDTAMHYALTHCDCKKIRQLLSYNPPMNIKNNENQTPLDKLSHSILHDRHSVPLLPPSVFGLFVLFSGNRQNEAFRHAGVLSIKMLVTAGANPTADFKCNLDKFHSYHLKAQLPDYKNSSVRSLKEMCRFVIRESVHVPVDASLCKLPISKQLQEYLDFPELDSLVDEYINEIVTFN